MKKFLLALLLCTSCADSGSAPQATPLPPLCAWEDYAGNPIIFPRQGQPIIGDPTFLPPDETPDGKWHLYAYALDGIDHFASTDGLAWERIEQSLFGDLHLRPYLFKADGRYVIALEALDTPLHSTIELRFSDDLKSWSDPTTILEPTFAWERSIQQTTGNPFLIRIDGRWRLYYSAGTVFLHDSIYFEPKYLGLAYADDLTGPYVKQSEPYMSPDPGDPYLNLGMGSFKMLPEQVDGRWIAFNNTMYEDAEGNSRSAIRMLVSDDALTWEDACPEPILKPTTGWRRAYVYAFDARRVGDELWLYYNARDGWFEGKERIGLARLKLR